ncbi:PTS system mannose/fructose/sorbose-specific IIB component [Enterococcus sp. 10A9_DIV0425]|uniref:PTS system mannose/fructose/sorbose-specific IIB component n=1 Tax=Candidatus Enterococcus wittei TaxID=1987383 RepID=A0A242JWI6_9ENTE|nr:mannose/fructose/sorbose PTS transporter subunit IIB [Enterococcus sp. 10A9_DIV0425]OTP09592.1 PTS system mannose/fructose/sorbose-specific IIB component [Enterococcus sp. 10A9_DIV0425]THE15639.1 PTS fructose transporter subunit IIB [Enterococcus hirae]
MDIRLARIDDRLIHGQVATVWSKLTGVERIIVISDVVAQDTLRKFLLKEAAPPGIMANVITVKKMIQIFQSGLLAKTKVMLLFTNPQDVETIVRSGVHLDSLNIGGMSFSEGKTMITNFVSVDQRDIDAFLYLNDQGVELEIRKVPADRKVFLMELLTKAKKA